MKKVLIAFALAGVLLAGCGGDTGGDDPITQAVMRNAQPTPPTQTLSQDVQPEMQAATPTPDLPPAEVAPQYIEVPVERVVVVTATPEIQNFTAPSQFGVTGYADASTCDPMQPQDAPRAGGVNRVIGCADRWNDAYEVKP